MSIDWAAIDAFKSSDEYRRLGVLGRERALYERFPELAERHRALSARHLERSAHGRAYTPDPEDETP